MKKGLFILCTCAFVSACSSKPPMQPQPYGSLEPVYMLQDELNQRHNFGGDMTLVDKHYKEMRDRQKLTHKKEQSVKAD